MALLAQLLSEEELAKLSPAEIDALVAKLDFAWQSGAFNAGLARETVQNKIAPTLKFLGKQASAAPV